MQLDLDDCRRLTGPNLFGPEPGAVAEVSIAGADPDVLTAAWRDRVRLLLLELGWADSRIRHRCHAGGASLMISAPIDGLYAATEIVEAAWLEACADLGGEPSTPADRAALAGAIAAEANPRLLALRAAAQARGQIFLNDDDAVSVGAGSGSVTWPADALPDPGEVDWRAVSSIPVALVTGTNGKSTSVRLAARVVQASGRQAGLTSTDDIRSGDEVLDQGDYSGPGGARTLLRDRRVEIGLLEVARGGMLRRGLGVSSANAALITNVAADHLGEYGINTVADLIEVKLIVRRALANERPLILNADDQGLVERVRSLREQRLIWFAEDPDNPVVAAHRAAGGFAVSVKDGQIVLLDGSKQRPIAAIDEIPITFGGTARHNVQNALGASALCHALGIARDAIREGLRAFAGTPEENPGRGNFFSARGVRVLVDFAHNEHGLKAVADTVARHRGGRRLVMLGQAGDRTDEAIGDLLSAALRAEPDRLLISELPGHERGRAAGEVARLLHRNALSAGFPEHQIVHVASPAAGARGALRWAQPGDFLLLLALTEREEIIELVREFGRVNRPVASVSLGVATD